MSHILYHSSPASPARFAFDIDPDAEDEEALGVWFFSSWETALTAAGDNGVVNAARVETDGPAKALGLDGFEDMQKKAFSYTEGAGVYYRHLRDRLLKDGVQQIDVVGKDNAVTRSVVLDVDLLEVVDRRYAAMSEDEADKRCLEISDAEFLALHHENQYRIIMALRRMREAVKVEEVGPSQSEGIKVRLKELAERRAPITKRLAELTELRDEAWDEFASQFGRKVPAPTSDPS